MDMEDVLLRLIDDLHRHGPRNAFYIGGVFHTYAQLSEAVDQVRAHIRQAPPEPIIGLMAHDDLLTYAAILALWAEGRAYLPLSPGSPTARNEEVLAQAGVRTVLTACDTPALQGARMQRIDHRPEGTTHAPALSASGDATAYLLFTSGTTGRPKGVPISRGALAAFMDAFQRLGLDIGPEDRCLQMFELTFDLSVMSYLVPLLHGACVYTIPKEEIKYTYIHELLEDQRLTVALMVPSILNFLRPYFEEVHCPSLRINLFCGEALPLDVVEEWAVCAPNARIINVYGPTEHTIFCTASEYDRRGPNKESNGVFGIGKPMYGTTVAIIDEERHRVEADVAGELCLAGPQGTAGYWNDPERNKESFVTVAGSLPDLRFYRTGDRCRIDPDGDIIYLGRMDHQVKVQGFRVELAELEHHAKGLLDRRNLVATTVRNAQGNTELVLVIEGHTPDRTELGRRLKAVLPPYMVPAKILHLDALPLNTNGKIDRPAVTAWVRNALA